MRLPWILSLPICAIVGLTSPGCNGSDTKVIPGGTGPQIQISPGAVLFNEEFNEGVYTTTSPSNAVALLNTGTATLDLSGVTQSGDSAFKIQGPYAADQTTTNSIAAGKSAFLNVTFSPTEGKQYSGAFIIHSNANNTPNLTVEMAGCGIVAVVTDGGIFTDGGASYCVLPFDAGTGS